MLCKTSIRSLLVFIFISWTSVAIIAQETDSTEVRKVWEVRGYVKNLQSLIYNQNLDSLVTSNLIHNRINIRWNPSSKFTGGIEFRNRLFWGEDVRLTPNFSDKIRNNNEVIDASFIWFETESMLLETNVDRFWLEYNENAWEARIGRQRINWGINTTWNPNDIFNTYNFLDFDYEERPGRDAVKVCYHLTEMSNIELAAAGGDYDDESVAAIKYFTNHWNYDFQFLVGIYHEILTLGTGWSGSIKDAGFKGEFQYFASHRDTSSQINLTMEIDYLLKKGWYVNGGFLFNSTGINDPINYLDELNFQLTPQRLMPTKWNTIITVAKEITPLLSANLSTIYSPSTNLLIALPSLKYNLATNLDFEIIWQSFFAEQSKSFNGITHTGFIRLKWSF